MSRATTVNLAGSAIRARRLARLLTQADLAVKLHCSPRTISLAEAGGPVGVAMARAIARGLGMPYRDVVAPAEEQPEGTIDGGFGVEAEP